MNTTIDGKKVTLRDLQSVMSRTQALIVSKILHYSKTREFIVCDDDGNIYVRKSLEEWMKELELVYENGRKRNVSKSYTSKAFNTLANEGILKKLKTNGSHAPSYGLCKEEIKKRLKHLFA